MLDRLDETHGIDTAETDTAAAGIDNMTAETGTIRVETETSAAAKQSTATLTVQRMTTAQTTNTTPTVVRASLTIEPTTGTETHDVLEIHETIGRTTDGIETGHLVLVVEALAHCLRQVSLLHNVSTPTALYVQSAQEHRLRGHTRYSCKVRSKRRSEPCVMRRQVVRVDEVCTYHTTRLKHRLNR